MANLFSLADGNVTDTSIFYSTLTSSDITNNTTGVMILTSDLISNYSLPITGNNTTITALAVHLSARNTTPVGTLSCTFEAVSGTLTKTGTTLSSASPFGDGNDGSIYFNGANSISLNQGFAFGSGDFTLEVFVYPLTFTNNSPANATFFENRTSPNDSSGFAIGISTTGNPYMWSTNTYVANSPRALTLSAWNHLVFSRQSNKVFIYVNGFFSVSAANSYNFTYRNFVFGTGLDTKTFKGYISNIRVSNTTAFYSGNSNITVPTSPLSPINGTQFLYKFPYDNYFINVSTDAIAKTTEVYAISSFTSFDGSNNFVTSYPQNWQLLNLSNQITTTLPVRYNFKTSNPNQISFVGLSSSNNDTSFDRYVITTNNPVSINTFDTVHIVGVLSGLNSYSRSITADNITLNNLYIHNKGSFIFPFSNKTVTLTGSNGLQITSEGTLNIGSISNPVPSNITTSISGRIDVHNGANLNIVGSPKLAYSYLTTDSTSGTNSFTVTDDVSSTWSSSDTLVYVPNTYQKTSFDNLTIASFNNSNTFTTNTNATYNHPSITSINYVPTISNLTRNVKIAGYNASTRGYVRAVDGANVNIVNTQFTNFGVNGVNQGGIVLGTNTSGSVLLSGNAFNSDGTANSNQISFATNRTLISNVTANNNVIYKSGTYGIVLNSLSANNIQLSNNIILSSGNTGLYVYKLSGSNLTMNNNVIVGSNSYGTYVAQCNTSSTTVNFINYGNKDKGLVLSADNIGTISNIIATYNTNEGVYVDGTMPNLSSTLITNITANNNNGIGFRVIGNSYNPLTPITLNINNIIANNNVGAGIEAYSIGGNLSSITLKDNTNYGFKTSFGNLPTTIDGLTSTTTSFVSAVMGVLSGTSYYPIYMKNSILSGSNTALLLDSTNFKQFNVESSTISATTASIRLSASTAKVQGSYLFNDCTVKSGPISGLTNYQSEVFKSTGFAFTEMNSISANHITYLAAGARSVDPNIYINRATAPSERLAPSSTTTKLRSGSKFIALNNGDSVSVQVYVRKSSATTDGVAYNGNSPRLMLKRNAAAGITTDITMDQLDVVSENFIVLGATTPTVTDNCVLEFYVDCDGTQGWINVDNWLAS